MLTNALSHFKAPYIGLRSFSFWRNVIQQPKELQTLLDQIREERRLDAKKSLTETDIISPVSHRETICVLLHELIHRAETMNETPLAKQFNLLKRTPYRGVLGLEYPFEDVSIDSYKRILRNECYERRIGVEDTYPLSFEQYLLYILAFPAKFRYVHCYPIHENILNTGHQFPSAHAGFNPYGELDLAAWDALHSPPHSGLKPASVVLEKYRLSTPWVQNPHDYWKKTHLSSEVQLSKHLLEYCAEAIRKPVQNMAPS